MTTKIFSKSYQDAFKVNKQDFTRQRKLTFPCTIIFMLNLIKKSLSIEIDGFVNHLKSHREQSFSLKPFSSSAYVQSRKKIKAEVFISLSSVLVDEFYSDNDLVVKLWNGFRLLAVDGSTMNLPSTRETHRIYGKAKNQTGDTAVQGRVSVLYDVLNQLALDADLAPRSSSERELALKHLGKIGSSDLIIYDRGYYSYEFIKEHVNAGIDFIIRAKADLNIVKSFIASNKNTQTVEITLGRPLYKRERGIVDISPIKIRLVRVELPKGEIEVIATSLLDVKKYPSKQFKALYFKRWKVETYYDELKNKLKAEHFTGYSNRAIQQDFHTAILVSNIQSLIVNDLKEEINIEAKARKWEYKVNTNLSYGFLKNRILNLFLSNHTTDLEVAFNEIKELFKKHLVPIKPNRSNHRNKTKRITKKHKVTKNQRDAI
ncbi:IS4 family transposase [Flavivirga rizhaonensis]|uniref:IS4 family transposase n=1 Tax=Flavivirga rizhaonensis TaxID=2559571 RepID=A0A4S1DQN9_9FLAO|nr:IS4 family transposase [Flavivirga rizhaonensis]TGV00210.1 IS4 family transposase [Flavivirga rizhaonensis]